MAMFMQPRVSRSDMALDIWAGVAASAPMTRKAASVAICAGARREKCDERLDAEIALGHEGARR